MEFLDSLDLDTIDKKSHRVRSWYLYEQFKSLERSQLNAAQKLKDRSYQERILRQELSERRARRKLYDQFGLCQSDSRLISDKSARNNRTTVSTSEDDFFESFYLLHEEERVTQITGANEFSCEGEGEGDTFSQDCLSVSQCCIPNYVSVEDYNKDDSGSYCGSVTSVLENSKPSNDKFLRPPNEEFMLNSIDEDTKISIAEDIKSSIGDDTDIQSSIGEDIKNSIAEYIKISIAEDIKISKAEDLKNSKVEDLKNSITEDLNMQFASVKEDILCLEKIANLEDVDKISEESFHKVAVRECSHVKDSKKADQECNVIALWSRLVSFAYQVVQLNHGNCYCDYSSQFLTVVLACDVLRIGVTRMCHILQPYVSPIKFASDESDASDASASPTLNNKRKKSLQSRKYRKICELQPLSHKKAKSLFKTSRSARKCTSSSENLWRPFYTQSLANGTESKARPRGWSEPWHGSAKIYNYRDGISPEPSSSAIWSDILDKKPKVSRRRSYRYHNKALHPMLKIAQCIDSILKDIDDYKHDM